ncbi:unnamed protein product [Litomosoides sigmodontis]|uniref:Uncharacterized protein n=1 Tax=Litomosoides sigmodontis TaxID=42156 RepID=A0A3P6UHS9_LITSI|nr:unnamed protein product [Litomosoides sigmodontis]
MFFYSAQSRALRRLSIAAQGSETRLGRQIDEVTAKQSIASSVTGNEQEGSAKEKDRKKDNSDQHRSRAVRSSSLANAPCYSTSDTQIDKKSNKHYYRWPAVTIQSDGQVIIGGLGRI